MHVVVAPESAAMRLAFNPLVVAARLHMLREWYPGVPMMALTATATTRVRADILANLQMKNARLFSQSFNRVNLYYEVREKKGKVKVG